MWTQPKKKYGNQKSSSSDGRSFSSKLERALYELLQQGVLDGRYSDLQCQDHVYLTEARILYIPDFRFFDEANKIMRWAEAKGFETDVWRIKRRLWKHYGPGPLDVWKGSEKNLKLVEILG